MGRLFVAAAMVFGCGNATNPGSGQSPGGGSGAGLPPAGQHALHLHITGNGQARSSAPAFSCASDCQQMVDASVTVHLVALPDSGWKFDGWQGACSGAAACEVPMSGDHDVTAIFSAVPPPPPGNVRVSVVPIGNGGGRITSAPAGIDCPGTCFMNVTAGSMVNFSGQPDASSSFSGWGGGCSGSGGCSVTASADVTVWANFTANVPPPPPPPPPGPPAQCASIPAPAAVAMQQYVARPRGGVGCLEGLGDANGTLAFPMAYNDPNSHGSLVDFFRSGGTVKEQYFESEGPNFVQQPSGLTSAGSKPHMWPYPPVMDMGRWDTAGNYLGDSLWYVKTFAAAGDPAGGLFVAGDLGSDGFTPAPTYRHEAVMFNGGGQPYGIKWGPQPLASAGAVFGAGVDLPGRAIVITDGYAKFGAGSISAQWFDKNGTALTGEFVLVTGFVAGASTWFEPAPLIGGGVEVRRMDASGSLHAQALALVQSGAAVVSPPPAWMSARPDTRLVIARGGKAYAVLPYGAQNTACTQKLELLAPDGTSCGSADYPIAAGACNTPDLTLAADGTVIQQLPREMEAETSPSQGWHTCTWRFWTGALR